MVDRSPQAQRFGDRGLGVVGQIRGAFQTDIAVAPSRLIVDGAQHVGGGADVGDRQVLVNLGDAVVGQAWNRLIASEYSSVSAIAFSKIEGLDVTPFNPSCSMSARNSPSWTRLRFR